MALWIFGVALSVGCSVVANIGLLVQKLSLKNAPDVNEWKQPKWLCGLLLFISAQIGGGISLSFAPQCVLASLTGVSLVSNSFFAPLLLKERYTRIHLLSSAIITIGCVMVVVFSPTPKEMTQFRMKDVSMFARALPTFPLLIATYMISIGVGGRIFYATHIVVREKGKAPASPFIYNFVSALAGALGVTWSRASVLIIRMAIIHDENPLDVPFLCLVVMSLVCSLTSVAFMNAGLFYFDALYVIPLYYSLATVCQSVLGGVFYDEFAAYSVIQSFGFAAGLLTNIFGVWLLAVANTACLVDLVPEKEAEPVLPRHTAAASAMRSSMAAKHLLRRTFTTKTKIEDTITESHNNATVLAEALIGQLSDGGLRQISVPGTGRRPISNSRAVASISRDDPE